MASKLNPGADTTLVNVAYRAALANTPKDYSSTLESVARGYEKTMQSSAEMWKDIATVGSAIGADMIKTSNKFAAAAAKGAALDSESATFLQDEVYALKDEFKELGLLPGIFGDRETKKKRAELRLKQAELFAEIDNTANSIAQGAAAISNGTYDSSLGSFAQNDMINAIVKSNLKNKITEQGNYAKLSRDEETGELMYTLYRKDGSLSSTTGEPETMTMTQFNEAIAKNKKDGGAMLNSLNTRIDNHYNNGLKSRDGVYDDKMKAADTNFIEALLGDDPINLKRAMKTIFGYSQTSFYDDITNPLNGVNTEFSMQLYNDLLKVTGVDGELEGKITKGMVDANGDGSISQQEAMTSDNYKILTANLLGLTDAKASKEFFKQYAVKNYQDSFEYGYSKKAPGEGSDSDDSGFILIKGSGKSEIGADDGNGYIPNSALNTIGKKAHNRDDINIGVNNFIWDEKEEVYKLDGVEVPNKLALFDAIYGTGFDPKNILSMYNSIEDWQGDTRAPDSFDDETGLDISFIDKADEVVASNLNKLIPPKADTRNPRNLSFKARGGGASFGYQVVGLYDEDGLLKYPDVYPDGVVINGEDMSGKPHPNAGGEAIFGTRAKTTARNTKNLEEMIDILKTFGLYDNTKPIL